MLPNNTFHCCIINFSSGMVEKFFKIPSRILIILILIVSNESFPQEKFSVGLSISPSLVYYNASDYMPYSKEHDKAQFGYSFGMMTSYALSPHFTIETGIIYQKKTILTMTDVMDTRHVFIDLNGNGIFDYEDRLDYSLIDYIDLYSSYSSAGLPVLLNYRTSSSYTTSIITSLGLTFNYIYNLKLLSESEKYGMIEEGRESLDDFTSSIMIGVALYQPLSSSFYLICGPRYYLDFTTTKPRFQTLALELKIFYNL